MGRLLLVDGHSLAYRAFYALPAENFSTSTGQTTNAVYGFTSMLINVLRDEEPTHLAVAFDVSKQTFRLAEYAEYKAGRSVSPPEFPGQIPLIREVLGAMGVRMVTAEGYEADDVICTLTRQARAAGHDVLVVSGDRDAFQLVDDHVTVLYPVRGVSELTRMTPDAVVARYGVPPERYPDLAALVGETSDNLPGVPGVGPKTAAKWITQYDGLAGVVAHADQIKGKAGESFREHIGDVERNRRLNRLVDDLDLGRRGRGAEAAAVGPRRHPHRLRRPGVPGPARAAVRDPRQRRARGDRRVHHRRAAADGGAGRRVDLAGPGRRAGRGRGRAGRRPGRSRHAVPARRARRGGRRRPRRLGRRARGRRPAHLGRLARGARRSSCTTPSRSCTRSPRRPGPAVSARWRRTRPTTTRPRRARAARTRTPPTTW